MSDSPSSLPPVPPAAPPAAPLAVPPAVPPAVRVLVNGEPRELTAGATVSTLLSQLGYASGSVAVERNREVVPRRAHGTTELLSGDELEVVTFVGGG